ncbi:MAG: hypothetical protein HN781_07405 [Betaproteobacteria bacterium]|nr:hypothetical protein [Betaproteobacteria bacterium]
MLGIEVRQRIFSSMDTLNKSTALPLAVKLLFGPNACGQSSAQRAVDIKKEINKKSLIKG